MVQIKNINKKQTKQDKAIAKETVDWQTGGLNPPASYLKNPLKKTKRPLENISKPSKRFPYTFERVCN